MLANLFRAARCVGRAGHNVRVVGRSHIRHAHQITPTGLSFVPRSPRRLPRALEAKMASLESVTQQLSSLSISPAASVTHQAASEPQQWRDAIEASGRAPESFELLKTFVYKPKTAKTATVVPVVVIASEKSAGWGSQVIGKKFNLKDLRAASDDLLNEFFGLDKHSRMSRLSSPRI